MYPLKSGKVTSLVWTSRSSMMEVRPRWMEGEEGRTVGGLDGGEDWFGGFEGHNVIGEEGLEEGAVGRVVGGGVVGHGCGWRSEVGRVVWGSED